MRRRPVTNQSLLVLALVLLSCGCADFDRRDEATIIRLGGAWVPAGEAWTARAAPVDSVRFDAAEHSLSDAEFAEAFPALRRMDPVWLDLRGSGVSDASVPLINRLLSLRHVDLRDTGVTSSGLAAVRRAVEQKSGGTFRSGVRVTHHAG
jgi:hypothetical protein